MRDISDIYVRIIFIYNLFIDSCLSESNIQYSMLALHKDNNALLYKKFQENISRKCVSIFGNSQQLCHFGIYGIYILHEISASPILFVTMFYSIKI